MECTFFGVAKFIDSGAGDGLEPTTSSLGKRLSIDNKEHSVFVGLFLAIEITQFSFRASGERLMVFKWCSPIHRRVRMKNGPLFHPCGP
jgi:hypothetical protein